MRSPSSPLSRLRLQLAIGTALGSLAAVPALAQGLPAPNDAKVVHVDGGSAPTFSTPGGRLQVDLNARNTVIDWNGFNIPAGETIHFNEDRTPVLRDERAVLNRDVSGRGSELFGNLTSSNNIAVWVYNPNGILVGSSARFNTGSLILTTLNPTLDDFRNNRSTIRFTGPETSTTGISVANGAQIRVGGDNSSRGLVMIAPKIDADGQFVSDGRDIAFVTASDVTLRYTNNSPLSVTLHRGTAVPGRSQYVRGSVDGNDAIFALASQATLTDALLQVDARVTTASAGTRGIVLSAGAPIQAASGVTVEGANGVAGLLVNGNLTVDDGGGSQIQGAAAGIAVVQGNLTSDGNVRLVAQGALVVSGNVDAEGDYVISGRGVTLGNAQAGVVQGALGRVAVASLDGDIASAGTITLRSGGTASIALETIGTTAGDILLGSNATLLAGTNGGGDLNIRQRAAGNSVTLGDISANSLQSAVGVAPFASGLSRTGGISLGDVNLRGAITIEAGSLATGSLTTNRSVSLTSAGAISTGGITARDGGVVADGVGAVTIGGNISAAGALTLHGSAVRFDATTATTATSTGSIDILARSGGISSDGALTLRSTSGTPGNFVRLQAAGPEGIVFADGTAITAGANRALRVGVFTAPDAPLVLGNVTARSLGALAALDGNAAQPAGGFSSTNSLTFGTLDLVDAFAAESTAGNLSVAGIAVTGNGQGISLRAANGILSVQNTLSASGDVTLASGGALTLDTVESRDGRTAVTAAGAVTLDRLSGALGATVQGASLDIGTISSGGAVSAVASSGGASLGAISGTVVDVNAATTLTLGSVDASGAITLVGSDGITATGLVDTDGGGLLVSASNGAVSLTGGARASGTIDVTGTSVALGGEHRALGAYRATATLGAITGVQGLSIASDAQGGSGGLSLTAPGGVLLAPGTALRAGLDGGSAIAIQANDASVRFGSATGASLSIAGASDIVTGDLTLRSDVSLAAAGGVTTGAIGAGPGAVTIDGGSGDVTTGSITAGGAATLTGGALAFGRIEAASLAADASTGNVTGGDVIASGGATVRALQGSLTLGAVRADAGNVFMAALGPMQLASVRAGGTATLSTTAAGAGITLVDGLEADGSVSVRSGGDIRGPFIRSFGGDLTVAAPNGSVGGLNGGGLALRAGPGGAFSLTVGTDAVLDDITANQISISAASLTVGSIDSNGESIALAATAGDLNVNGTLRGSDVSATATGTARLARIDATGAVTLNGGTALFFSQVDGASLNATSGGLITGGPITMGGAAELTAASLNLGNVSSGPLRLSASGDVLTGTLIASGDIAVDGAGLTVDSITSSGAVRVGATGVAQVGAIDAQGAVVLNGGTGLSFDGVNAASLVATSGGLIEGGPIATIGLADLAGGGLALGEVDAGTIRLVGQGDVTTGALIGDGEIAVTGAALTLGNVTAGGTVNASATGVAQIGLVDADGAVTLNGGTGLGFAGVSGASLRATSHGTITGGPIVTTGLAELAAGALRLNTIDAGSIRLVGQTEVLTGALIADTDIAVEGTTLTLGNLNGGTVSVNASGVAQLSEVEARSAVTLNGGSALGFTGVRAGSLRATSGGTITGGAIVTTGRTDVTGARLALNGIDAGAGLRLAATQGDVDVGALVTRGDAVIEAAGLAQLRGSVTAGGDYRVTGGRVVLGTSAVEQRANGAIRIVATQGDIAGAAGLRLASDADASAEAHNIVLDSAGGIELGGTVLQARPGGGATLGIRVGSGRTIRLGDIEAGRIGGWDGTLVTPTLTHDGDVFVGTVRASSLALALSAGNVTLGDVTATTGLTLDVARGTITTGALTGGTIDLSASGALSTRAIEASGDVTLEGDRVDVAGRLATARQLLARARQALALGDVSATAGGTLEAGTTLGAGQVDSSGALSLKSGGDLTLGSARAGGTIRIDANGLARVGALTASPSIELIANDAELSGAVRAGSVSFVNRAGASGAMRVGDDTQSGGFRLANTEVGLVTTDRLRVDAGAGALEIGTLSLAAGAGSTVEMLGTADVRVTGVLSSDNVARGIRIGGDAAGSADARTLHVVATSEAGGRLLVEGANLDLRANRIAVGLAPGFIDTLVDGPEGQAQANALISNPNSALYNALLGGAFYAPDATTTVAARSLTMRIGDYALFQNTAIPGQISGVRLGGTQDAPVQPALRIAVAGPSATASSFALFGTINGVGDATTALLGTPVLEIDPRLLPNSRINGCPAGSGVGCLTTIVIQPTLQVFTWDSKTIFGIASDVAVPFAPIVSGNNEELLTGLPALLPEQPSGDE